MTELSTDQDILAEAIRIAAGQPGGTLATHHAEDGTPYVTFVYFHLCDDGKIVFGSSDAAQHSRNLMATPEASFLIDTREVILADWKSFDRVVIEGRAERVETDDPRYPELLGALRDKNPLAAEFSERGHLFCIHPRRLQLRKGVDPTRYVVDFALSVR
jgi:nitroimidazol reductase NimA-like FMN-containing flavoprotein (pyridoxamine 5'-phosphate oxidase superfamily)